MSKKYSKISSYCADFYLPESNRVIDIKPLWRAKREIHKLSQGRAFYESKGYVFDIVDCNNIKKDFRILNEMWENGEIELYPASIERLKKRIRTRGLS